MQEGRAGHSTLLTAAPSFIFCLGIGFSLFFRGKVVLRRSQAGLENLLRFSSMVYNGTMGGINTLMIMGRDSAKTILGDRIREGRWEDFPSTLEPFVQSVYQKNCKLKSAAGMGEQKSPKVDGKSPSPFSRV